MKIRYKSIIVPVTAIIMMSYSGAMAQIQTDSTKVNVAFGQVERQDLLGGISVVNAEEQLEKNHHTYSLDGLESIVAGYSGTLWGQWPMIIVDGVPRDASDVLPSQIKEITMLKGASAVVLYGSRAAKGAILITTKKGSQKPMSIDMNVNFGMYVPKSYPKYLDAASYMTLYNEARVNDNLSPLYSESDIYNTAAGTNPYRYPDIRFYNSENLRKKYFLTDVTGQVSGGNEHATYYTNLAFTYNNSLLKFADSRKDNYFKFNLLSNVDLKITDWLTAEASAGAIIADGNNASSGFWYDAANLRPNWFSPLLPINQMDLNNSDIASIVQNSGNVIDGQYLLGGLSTNTTNSFANMHAGGYTHSRNRDFMFKLAVHADLDMILKGLSFRTMFDIDYWNCYNEIYNNTYAVYEPKWSNVDGKDIMVGLTKYNLDKKSTNEEVSGSQTSKTMTFSAQFDYNNSFASVHNVSATLMGWGWQKQDQKDYTNEGSAYHRTSNVNLGLSARYNYDHRYFAEVGLALVHSAKMPENNRNELSPSIALGWRINRESFMKDAGWIDNLKLNAAYTVLHQDLDISDFYLYNSTFNNQGGWFQWKDGGQGGWFYAYKRGANPDLRMITRKEARVGLEGSFWNRLFAFEVNLFTQDTDGGLISSQSFLPSYYNTAGLCPYLNYNKDRRQGFDFSVTASKRIGNVDINLGFVGIVQRNKALRRDETTEYDYLKREGQSMDASWGYVCDGFLKQSDIDNGYTSTFGSVAPGDLKYRDINEDGKIDTNDQIILGKSTAPFQYGVNLTLKWKDFTFYAQGDGQNGGIGYKNSSYYWVYGDRKYSEIVMGRWTDEATADQATYPRLTTTNNNNNFRNSTFWRYKTDCFNLTRIQLTYAMPQKWFTGKVIKGCKVYFNADNLLTISKERKHMEMNIGSAPQCRFYNIGLTANF